MLDLSRQPSTSEAKALVERLTGIVEKAAPASRPAAGRETLRDVLGRFSGPLLASSASYGTGEVIVPLDEGWFAGKSVTAWSLKRVVRGLQRADLIRPQLKSFNVRRPELGKRRKLSLSVATSSFRELAAEHGIAADEAERHFPHSPTGAAA